MKNKNKNEFNELPAKVSQKDFNRYILPYLSKGRRGPDPKISRYKFFNYILFVLHTGIQWEKLPIRNKETSWQAVYAKHNRWSRDGSYENLFLNSVRTLKEEGKLDLSILHGDGSNTVAKKGVITSDTADTNIRREKKS
jgi:transposase